MIVAKKSYDTEKYISYGNYAYDYKRYTENDTENEVRKAIKQNKAKHKADVRKKLKLITSVIVMLFAGMLIVGRYAAITELNNRSLALQNSISENQKINDDLNLELLKYCDIKQIEQYATAEIKMVRPDLNNVVHIDVANTDKDEQTAKVEDTQKKVSFLDRIISFFE